MNQFFDDIAAIATPPGHSALAIIRLSGSKAISIVSQYFSKSRALSQSPSHRAIHGIMLDEHGEIVDEVICTLFHKDHSYTGEDLIEISCHGNPRIVNRILAILLRHARMAEPGEFTLRAFLNGRIDLTQAEAVGDLIHSQTDRSDKSALQQLQGKLYKWITPLLEMLTNLRLRFEMAIDFADQDLPPLNDSAVALEFEAIIDALNHALAEGGRGKYVREGIHICLTGAVNVGKSSLFNAFLKEDRAIVTPHPGTTRDYLEETVAICGYPAVIYDTAGIRDTEDAIECIGISHTRRIIDTADIILYVIDPDGISDLTADVSDQRCILVLNKCDLLGFSVMPDQDTWQIYLNSEEYTKLAAKQNYATLPEHAPIPSSTILDKGLDPLMTAIVEKLDLPVKQKDSPLITNTRHINAINKALDAVLDARQTHHEGLGYELIALDLMSAANSLGEVVGIITTEEMLDRLFSNFCIGK